MRVTRLILIAVCISMLSACATVDIEKPVGQFAEAANAASDAVDEQNRAVTDFLHDDERTAAVESPVGVRLKDNSCRSDSPDCAIVFYETRADMDQGVGISLSDAPELRQIPQLMTQIAIYAANLDELARADSKASVKSSLDATVGSISNIAKSVSSGPETHERIQQIGEPTANIISWFAGQYLNKLKIDGLSKATAGADPLIQNAVVILKSVEQQLIDASKARHAEKVSDSHDAFIADPERKSLDKLIETADEYDQFLRSSDESVFDAMAVAHASLKDAMASGGGDLSGALADIQHFLSQANQLKGMSEDLAAAIRNGDQS